MGFALVPLTHLLGCNNIIVYIFHAVGSCHLFAFYSITVCECQRHISGHITHKRIPTKRRQYCGTLMCLAYICANEKTVCTPFGGNRIRATEACRTISDHMRVVCDMPDMLLIIRCQTGAPPGCDRRPSSRRRCRQAAGCVPLMTRSAHMCASLRCVHETLVA